MGRKGSRIVKVLTFQPGPSFQPPLLQPRRPQGRVKTTLAGFPFLLAFVVHTDLFRPSYLGHFGRQHLGGRGRV